MRKDQIKAKKADIKKPHLPLKLKLVTIEYFKTRLSVYNIHMNLCGQVENCKWILFSRQTGVKCKYLRFLMYKIKLPPFDKYTTRAES